jgi:TIR domain
MAGPHDVSGSPAPQHSNPTYRYDFFISFAGDAVDWASWIANELETIERGPGRWLRVLFQLWEFRPGSNWVELIERGVTCSERVAAVLSPAYLGSSRFGAAEWQAVWHTDPNGLARRVVPIRVAPCTPTGLLGAIVYIDLVGLTEPSASAKLREGIRSAISDDGRVPRKPRFPGPA